MPALFVPRPSTFWALNRSRGAPGGTGIPLAGTFDIEAPMLVMDAEPPAGTLVTDCPEADGTFVIDEPLPLGTLVFDIAS
jgi:hypothetical protein